MLVRVKKTRQIKRLASDEAESLVSACKPETGLGNGKDNDQERWLGGPGTGGAGSLQGPGGSSGNF